MKLRKLLLPSCLLLTSACSMDVDGFAARLTTPAERAFAVDYLDLVSSGQLDTAKALLSSELKTSDADAQMNAVATLLAAHPPDSLRLIGVQVNAYASERFVNFSWEYPSRGTWLLVNVAAVHGGGPAPRVTGFRAQELERSLIETNAFSLTGRSPQHFVWLFAVVAMPLFCLAVAIRVASAHDMPRRWRWVAFAVVGVGKVALSWTTGATGYQLLSLSLLAAGGAKAAPAAPWIFSFSFPIGAIVALDKYRRWRRSSVEAEGAVAV